jgi:TonB family protein
MTIDYLDCSRSIWTIMRCLRPVLLILTTSIILAASDKSKREGADLIQAAETKGNLFERASFEMKAEISIDNKGNPIHGSYTLLWNGPEQWREEISLPGYSEIQVGSKGFVSQQRTTDFRPLVIDQLFRTLNYGQERLAAWEKVKRVHDRDINGVNVACAEIANSTGYTREVCVDKSTGALVRQSPFVDKELMPVATKLFPRFLDYVENGKPLIEVHVTEITTSAPVPSSAFDPPAGSVQKSGCRNPVPGRIVKKVSPVYPPTERMYRVQGTVWIYAVVGADGVLHNLRIIAGVDPGLNSASLNAVQQWRYEPYTCDGTPVDVETVLQVNYRLSSD